MTETHQSIIEILRSSGYMLTSNKHGILSRVDKTGPCKYGFDHYRRCSSKDKIEDIPRFLCKFFHSGCVKDYDRDTLGFRPIHPLAKSVIALFPEMRAKEREHWIEHHKRIGTWG